MTTVADLLIESLADLGVRTVWGVVGDALNPITDAIRTREGIEWIGVRHEEAGWLTFLDGVGFALNGRQLLAEYHGQRRVHALPELAQ